MTSHLKKIIIASLSKGAGKTALAEALLGVIGPAPWAAAKITLVEDAQAPPSYLDPYCRRPEFIERGYVIVPEEGAADDGVTDTRRFARAGARPVFWIIARPDAVLRAWIDLVNRLGESAGVIVESSTLALRMDADLTLLLIDISVPPVKWKSTADALIGKADVIIVRRSERPTPAENALLIRTARRRARSEMMYVRSVADAVQSSLLQDRLIRLLS
ncbi:MAG: hypothetical protein D6723_10055 [Acidobacteria bacterium]|nr:MAG: hypothetical protein D6723_10055 [Acidobacteriota bacterium]